MMKMRNSSVSISRIGDFTHPTIRLTSVTGLTWSEKFDHLAYSLTSFVTADVIEKEKVGLADEVFLIGLFYGNLGKKRNTPIVRIDNIAMPEERVYTEDLGHSHLATAASRRAMKTARFLQGCYVIIGRKGEEEAG